MLSIIVSWRDRPELIQTLPGLVAFARSVDGELAIVNYGGNPSLLRDQIQAYADELAVIQIDDQPFFNKSRAHNLGIAHTSRPILFFCDCDIMLQPRSAVSLFKFTQQEAQTFGTLAGVRESHKNARGAHHVVCFGYELRIRTADGRQLQIVDNEEDAEDGTRQAPGLLMVRREDILAVNGYNGRLIGWGWEDQDMIARLTLGVGLKRICRGFAIHLSHDDQARVAHYPITDRWESRDKMFRQALANFDRGDFQGTYEIDRRHMISRCFPGSRLARPSAASAR